MLFLDTETTGLPDRIFGHYYEPDDFHHFDSARLLQLAYIFQDTETNVLIRPDGFRIENSHIHGITMERACMDGVDLREALERFRRDLTKTKVILGWNTMFDIAIIASEMARLGMDFSVFERIPIRDLMLETQRRMKISKYPTLKEGYSFYFPTKKKKWHDAIEDIRAVYEIVHYLE